MRLTGRDAECARLDALLEGARRGRSAALALVGESGIGKTELLDYAVEHAQGMTVLKTCGLEAEAGLAFSALADLLRPVMPLAEAIPPVQANALRTSFALEPAVPPTPYASAAATLSLLGAAAEAAPLLGVVDDAQWLDAPSADALLFAARRLDSEGIVLLFAGSPGTSRFEDAGVECLPVEGLDERSARTILRRSAPDAASEVGTELLRLAQGNPLALTELPRQLSREELSGQRPLPAPLPMGRLLRRAFVRRLDTLPEETRRALLLAAASGSESLAEVGGAIARVGLTHALDPAERAGLLVTEDGPLKFSHPLVRSAVYSAASVGERRDAHALLAEETPDGTYGEERRAWHRAAAAAGPAEEAAAGLESAAMLARRRGGVAAEAELLERAAELTPDPPARSRRRLLAARAARFAGRMEAAGRLAAQALTEADDGLQRAQIRELQAMLAQWHETAKVSWSALLDAADDARKSDPGLAARLLALAAPVAVFDGLDSAAADALDRAHDLALGLGEELDASTAVVVGNAFVLCGREREGYSLAIQQHHALDAGDVVSKVEARLHFAILCYWVEDYDRARDVLERTIEAIRAESAVGFLPLALDTLAAVHSRLGRWAEAYAFSTEALQLADATGQTGLRASFLSSIASLEAAQGREAECREHAFEALALADRRGNPLNAAYALAALGRLELSLGRPEQAIRHLVKLEEMARSGSGLLQPGVVPSLPDLIEAYVRAGRRSDAVSALEVFAMQAARAQSPWGLAASARCAGLLSDDGSFEAQFQKALAWHSRDQRPFEQARTELCFGERLRRARRHTEARAILEKALVTFERLGAAPWADRAARELGLRGKRSPAGGSAGPLSPKELQVALLVARGATNREAAAALFLSPKTIEAHLSRVYAKLRVRSRTELAAQLLQQEPADPALRDRETDDAQNGEVGDIDDLNPAELAQIESA
jgi:DNA-binding CsgD family transcriptional regulator